MALSLLDCSQSRTTDQICRHQSRGPLTAEESLAAEESLTIYYKPVELYNILQRRAIRNVKDYMQDWTSPSPWRLQKRLEKDIRFNYFWIRSIKLLFVSLLLVHCDACLYYLLAYLYPHQRKTRKGPLIYVQGI